MSDIDSFFRFFIALQIAFHSNKEKNELFIQLKYNYFACLFLFHLSDNSTKLIASNKIQATNCTSRR